AGGSAAGGTGAGVTAGAGGTGGAGAPGLGGALTRGTGAARAGGVGGTRAGDPGAGDLGVGGTGAGGAGARGTGARDSGARGTSAGGTGAGRAGVLALGVLELAVLVLEALCNGARFSFRRRCRLNRHLTRSFARSLSESRPASPVRTGRRVPRPRPPPVLGTYIMALRPSSVPLRVPLPSPPASSLGDGPELESDLTRAANPSVPRLLTTIVTDPSVESTAASALVAELVEFAAACRLDYAASLVAEYASASVCPPSVGGECALGTEILEDRQEEFECFAAAVPHLVSMLIAPEGDPDAPDIPTPRSYAEATEGPYSSQWQAAMDAKMASWKSTGTYVDEVPPPRANIVSGMWIFRVKRPSGSLPVFKARYVARGFSKRQGVDFFQTFSPTPKMTTLRVLLHVATQRDYELHSLDFSTAFLQGSLHEEIWLCRPPGFTGSFPVGTQWSLRRPVYGLRQAPHEWHDTLKTTLAALGFAPSTSDPSLFLRTDTTLPPFYVLVYVDDLVFATADTEALAHVKSELQKRHTCTDLGELTSYLGLRITRDRAQRTITLTQSHMVQQVLHRFGFTYSSPQSTPLPTSHSLSAPPLDESVEPSGPYPELVGCLITSGMGLVLGGRARFVLTGHADASWVDDLATQRSSQGYTFSLGSGSVSWRSTRSSSVLSSSCEAEIYAGAMAAQELRWLTYLLTDLGEAPRSPPFLYVNNKAMLALCQEHRLEHRTKHIALRYFLARELQQRGQFRLAYVASQANTADVFTKALQPCDHQPCFASLDWSCDLLFSPTLPMELARTKSLPRFTSPSTLLSDILDRNLSTMAPTNNNSPGAKDATPRPSSGLEKTTRETGAEKRKHPTEENAEGPHTGVDVLLGEGGGTRSCTPQPRASHKQAHGPAVANDDEFVVITGADAGGSRVTQKRRATDSPATEGAAANLSPSQVTVLLALLQKQAAAPVTTPTATTEAENFASAKTANIRNNVSTSARVATSHRADKGKAPAVEDEPAEPDDSDSDSDSDAGEEPNNPMPLLPNDLLPPLPSPHPSTAAAAFNRKGVRDQAEVFEALQTYLAHVEHKIRGGDAAGALKTIGQAQDLIKRRFDILVVADHAGFDVAERYQLLKTTAVLTSRSFKMAVADMAALKRMKTGFARRSRPFHRNSPHFMPKTMGSGNRCRGFKGTCFRCGQNGHMASACPHRGHGGNGPALVV
ncbi:unnamed protein product, partial [Closterium sp. NIES-53]